MRVLKDNYNKSTVDEVVERIKPYPRKTICDGCLSELEYEESDLYMGSYGCMHLDCPLCGEDNMLDHHEKNIVLTKDNIEFPTHFHHVCKENGAVDRTNSEEIRKDIKRAIEFFRKNKNEYSCATWSGNLFVSVHRYAGDEMYDVTLTNDFYTMDIPFESADY